MAILVIIIAYFLSVTRYLRTRIIPTDLIITITLLILFENYLTDLLNDLISFQKAVKKTTITLIIVTPILQPFFLRIFLLTLFKLINPNYLIKKIKLSLSFGKIKLKSILKLILKAFLFTVNVLNSLKVYLKVLPVRNIKKNVKLSLS